MMAGTGLRPMRVVPFLDTASIITGSVIVFLDDVNACVWEAVPPAVQSIVCGIVCGVAGEHLGGVFGVVEADNLKGTSHGV